MYLYSFNFLILYISYYNITRTSGLLSCFIVEAAKHIHNGNISSENQHMYTKH